MIKHLIIFSLTLLFYFCYSSSCVEAKEYCHIHQDEELIETLQLPFYFYENSLVIDPSYSLPLISYESTHTFIDSLTKCDLINVTAQEKGINKKIYYSVYDYAYDYYDNITETTYTNSKLSKTNSVIKGYSSLIDEEPPIFQGYNTLYKTNIDNPIPLSIILSNITAYDNRDGNITSNIEIVYNEYEENTNKLGTYTIILSVSDSALNKTSLNIQIQIIDTTPPIITGKQNYTSNLSSPLSIEEIKKNLSATDNADQNITSQIYVCDDNYTKNKNKTGLYNIHFCVIDYSNNSSLPYKVVVEIKDDIPPIIEGLNTYTSYLSSPLQIQEILYSLAASDNNEDISSSIFIVSDSYSNNLHTLGDKKIVFQAMDKANNLSSPLTVTINVKDDIPPQIFGLDTYSSKLSSPLSLTHLKQQLTVLDNIDGNITSNLKIIDDTYTPNINKLGKFYISFNVTDNSNNTSELFKINITTIDDVPPAINGPSTLKYILSNKPSLTNVLSEFTVTDNIDGILEPIIEEDTFSKSFTTGTYYLTLSAIDTSNNKSIPFTTKIEIVDIILNLNEISLSLPTSKKYTIEEINKIINLNEKYTIIQDTYSPNYSIEGTYNIQYNLGIDTTLILTINTYHIETTTPTTTSKKETFFSKIKSFFLNIFNKIKQFLQNVFSLYFIKKSLLS